MSILNVTDKETRTNFIRNKFRPIVGKKVASVDFLKRYKEATDNGLTVEEIGTTFSPAKSAEDVMTIVKRETSKLVADIVAKQAAAGKAVDEERALKVVRDLIIPAPLGVPERIKSGARAEKRAVRENWLNAITAQLD